MNETALLKLLEKDARMQVCDLAAALDESDATIQEAMNRLTNDKVILGHHTLINWDKTNTDRVMALIEIYIFLIIYGKNMQEFEQFVGSKLSCIDKVTGTCTLFVLKKYKAEGIVFEAEEETNERLLVTP